MKNVKILKKILIAASLGVAAIGLNAFAMEARFIKLPEVTYLDIRENMEKYQKIYETNILELGQIFKDMSCCINKEDITEDLDKIRSELIITHHHFTYMGIRNYYKSIGFSEGKVNKMAYAYERYRTLGNERFESSICAFIYYYYGKEKSDKFLLNYKESKKKNELYHSLSYAYFRSVFDEEHDNANMMAYWFVRTYLLNSKDFIFSFVKTICKISKMDDSNSNLYAHAYASCKERKKSNKYFDEYYSNISNGFSEEIARKRTDVYEDCLLHEKSENYAGIYSYYIVVKKYDEAKADKCAKSFEECLRRLEEATREKK